MRTVKTVSGLTWHRWAWLPVWVVSGSVLIFPANGGGETLSTRAEEAAASSEPRPPPMRGQRSAMEYRSTLRVYDVDLDSRFRPVGRRESQFEVPDVDFRETPSSNLAVPLTPPPAPPRIPATRGGDVSGEERGEGGWGWLAEEIARGRERDESRTTLWDDDHQDGHNTERSVEGQESETPSQDREATSPRREPQHFFINPEVAVRFSDDEAATVEGVETRGAETLPVGSSDEFASPVNLLPSDLREDPIASLFRLNPREEAGWVPGGLSRDRMLGREESSLAAAFPSTGEGADRFRADRTGVQPGEASRFGNNREFMPGSFDRSEGYRPGMFHHDGGTGSGLGSDGSGAPSPGWGGSGSFEPAGWGSDRSFAPAVASPGFGGLSSGSDGGGRFGTPSSGQGSFSIQDRPLRSQGFDDGLRSPSALPW